MSRFGARFGARFDADGTCRLVDDVLGTEVVWLSVEKWASDWFDEHRAGDFGAACGFIQAACDYAARGDAGRGDAACGDAVPSVVEALIVLAEAAGVDADLLSIVGAGPIEDLVSHSGNGGQVLPEVDRAARQNMAFRAALRYVWVGADLPTRVRARLVELGARAVGAG